MYLIAHIFTYFILKGLGVTTLYMLGRISFFFNPARIAYSFKEIWNKDFNKGDTYLDGAEDFSQKVIGFGILMLICYCLTFLLPA
jgi:hypothetical protein